MMALLGVRIRARLETRSLGLRHVVLILIGMVGAAGLLLAALHAFDQPSDRPRRRQFGAEDQVEKLTALHEFAESYFPQYLAYR